MSEKIKNAVIVFSAAVFLFGLSLWCMLKPADTFSESERRQLDAFPKLSLSTVLSGEFMQKFESYTTDQIPMRDTLRTLKAFTAFYGFGQKDVNNIYMSDGYISKTEYPLDKSSLDGAAEKFASITEKYLKDKNTNVYLSIVPDKNYFLAKQNGYLAFDYDEFVSYLKSKTPEMKYIDIFGLLSLEDYYKTDTHWRQEKIYAPAKALIEGMGGTLTAEYDINLLDKPFYGVYYGQSALPLPSEELYYITNDTLDACKVTDHETNKEISVYDMEKAYGRDPYEIFLSGSKSLLTVKNEKSENCKKLIVFRDSFGSSIAPYFAEAYSEVVLIDIRYISSAYLGSMVDFENADVLFLYSTLVLNNSVTFK